MDWRLPFYGAFISYQFSDSPDRFDRSLQYLSRVESTRNCPSFVRRFKPHVLQKKGDHLQALECWHRLYENCDTPLDRAIIRRQLRGLAKDLLENSENKATRQRAAEVLESLDLSDSPPSNREGGSQGV
jgi:hypothetical protein